MSVCVESIIKHLFDIKILSVLALRISDVNYILDNGATSVTVTDSVTNDATTGKTFEKNIKCLI